MLPGRFDTMYRRLGNDIFQKQFWVVRVAALAVPEIYQNILFSITLTSDGPLTVCFRGLGDLTFYVENIFETEKEAQDRYKTELSCQIENLFSEKRNHLESTDQIQDQIEHLKELLEKAEKKK